MANLLRTKAGVGFLTLRKSRLSLAIAAALLPNFSLAQDQTDESGYEMILEEVIVTGSRIVSEDGFGRTSPVTVVGMEEIQSLGYTRVEEILKTLPQVQVSDSYSVFTETSVISLRALGPERTLTLINGRRLPEHSMFTTGGDINQIPPQMIERVEVLTGGASAVYGTDAVAGVVNFILRRVDGVEFSTGISGYQHDNRNGYMRDLMDERGYDYPTGNSGLDGKAYHASLIVGGDFADGRGNATAYAYWRKNDTLYLGERDYGSCSLNAPGTACAGSMTAEIPNFYIAPFDDAGNVLWPDGLLLTLQSDSSLAEYTQNLYNFNPVISAMRPDERWTLGAFADYEINQHAEVYLETMAYSGDSTGLWAESGLFFDPPTVLPLDNAYFPESYQNSLSEFWPGRDDFLVYIAKRNTEGGPRQYDTQSSSFRIVAGVRGLLAKNWNYDASYLYAQTSSSFVASNDVMTSRVPRAVDSRQCDPDPECIPYQVFTYQGVSREAAESLSVIGTSTSSTELNVVQAYVTGDTGWGLAAGTIEAVAGYEYRKNEFELLPDSMYQQGRLSGWPGGEMFTERGGYHVSELFIEANVPLLADRSFARNMVLDLAYRWSDYSTFGSHSTYRFGLDWQSLDWLRIRTGYNRAVRAPNARELFTPLAGGFWDGKDPCEGPEPEYSLEQCARTGVSEAQYGSIPVTPSGEYNMLSGGNPELQPEQADTFTLGIVVEPIETMQLSVDYWNIEIEDVIMNLWPDFVLEKCADYGDWCDNIVRTANGTLWQFGSNVLANTANLSGSDIRGVDVAWAWVPGDHWKLDFIGTYVLQEEWQALRDEPGTWVDCAGTTTCDYVAPDWKHVASVTWDSPGFWSLTGRWRFFGDVTYVGEVDQIASDNLGARSFLDLNVVIRFADGHDVSLGVNNILDEEPPLLGARLSRSDHNTDPHLYDPLGRFLYATLNLRY